MWRCGVKRSSLATTNLLGHSSRRAISSLHVDIISVLVHFLFPMRLLSILLVGAALGANAFGVAPRFRATTQLTSLQLSAAKANEPDFVKKAVKTIGALSLGSVLAFNVADASASTFVPHDATVSKWHVVFMMSSQRQSCVYILLNFLTLIQLRRYPRRSLLL